MKIGLINRSDIDGGAGVAALRLFRKLKERNADVKYLVGIKHGDNASTMLHYKSDFYAKIRNFIELLVLNKRNGKFPFSLCEFHFPLKLMLKYHKIDIVHLHWIGGGFISIKSLSKINKPIVWTMHDSWPFTGGCHIQYDCSNFKHKCGKCPQLKSLQESDLSRRMYNNKNESYSKIQKITFVSPSRWLAEKAAESSLLSNKKIVIIPNGIDTAKFCPKDKNEYRAHLNIKPETKVVLFGAVYSTSDRNKGYAQLLEAFNLQRDLEFEIMVFGSENTGVNEISGKKTYFLGRIWDENMMAAIYSAADVTVVPSLSENLSNVIMESLSCSTPVVAFNIGGNPDLIDHKQNGYLARPFETKDLAIGIEWMLFNSNISQLQENARTKVVKCFDIDLIADKYMALYNSVASE